MTPRGTITACLFLPLSVVGTGHLSELPAAETMSAPKTTFTEERSSLQPQAWPVRVLLTNDDGIDAPGLSALVRAFSPTTDVVVIAPANDRSGSTSYASILSRQVQAETEHVEGARVAYSIDGYPADCVLIGLTGVLIDKPPDLVISGINAGANIADAWAYSGTLGAARIAALHGIPAIAVSGGSPNALPAIAAWVAKLAGTAIVQNLQPFQYLTVDAPDIPLVDIKGVRVVPRARGVISFGARRSQEGPPERDVWVLSRGERQPAPPGTDASALASGWIAITTMQANEHDLALFQEIQERINELPAWAPTRQK